MINTNSPLKVKVKLKVNHSLKVSVIVIQSKTIIIMIILKLSLIIMIELPSLDLVILIYLVLGLEARPRSILILTLIFKRFITFKFKLKYNLLDILKRNGEILIEHQYNYINIIIIMWFKNLVTNLVLLLKKSICFLQFYLH